MFLNLSNRIIFIICTKKKKFTHVLHDQTHHRTVNGSCLWTLPRVLFHGRNIGANEPIHAFTHRPAESGLNLKLRSCGACQLLKTTPSLYPGVVFLVFSDCSFKNKPFLKLSLTFNFTTLSTPSTNTTSGSRFMLHTNRSRRMLMHELQQL